MFTADHAATDVDDDDAALRALYARHAPALLAYAERYTNDRGRAEDIVQETFVRAWRHLPRLVHDDRPARPWLFRVARRLLIDAARAAAVRPAVAGEGRYPEPAIDGGMDSFVNHSVLADALRRLSPAHRQIVVETFFFGTPTHLTAARLGVPAGTARSRLHYALNQLRRQLESDGLAA